MNSTNNEAILNQQNNGSITLITGKLAKNTEFQRIN